MPRRARFAVSFAVFGPEFGFPRARRRIVGFADVTSIYPQVEVPGTQISLRRRIRHRLRSYVSRRLTRTAHVVIVETSAMKDQLVKRTEIAPSRIRIVSNSYNALFDDDRRWAAPVDVPQAPPGTFTFAYVTRAYTHKNLDFLGSLGAEMDSLGLAARFLVTLRPEEWNARTKLFKSFSFNVGPVPVNQVPRIYQLCDAAVFPSLLEAFSAMPLEAMRMGLPVFASDSDFVRATCGDVPSYIDPRNAKRAAQIIVAACADPEELERRRSAGRAWAQALPSARDRALRYLEIIDRERDA